MFRILAALLMGGAVFTALAAAAAQLALAPSVLQAGGNMISSCDQDGVTLTYTLHVEVDRIAVSDVDVRGVARACGGKRMLVVLTQAGVAVAMSAYVQIPPDVSEGVPVRVPMTPPFPDARRFDGVQIVIGDL